MRGIQTSPHEFDANLLFTEWGLDPIFACDHIIKQADGKRVCEFTSEGERWVATLRYQESNIKYPGDRTPTGTEWQLQPDTSTTPKTIKREYRIEIKRAEEEDEIGRQGFVGHISPRWIGMQGVKDNGSITDIIVPKEIGDSVNVRVQGSNIEFARYPRLLRDAADAVDINARYFREVHNSSNISDAERYVRLHQDASGPVHARNGPLAELGHLLENDRDGYRKIVQIDQDHRGEQLPGYYHTTTLGPRRISKAWPGHSLPKEIKHYYAKEANNLPKSHPLSHPKLGASYQVSRWDKTLYFDELDQINAELEETVHSVLLDAGIDISPIHGEGAFVEGAYFNIDLNEIDEPTKLNLSQIRHEQESVVVRYLADGLSPVQWDALNQLVNDGGNISPDDIAESGGWHVESVRRALRKMEKMVDREYGSVGLRSDYVAEMVRDAVQEAERAVSNAVETAAGAMNAAERAIDENMAAWIAWCDKHDIDVSDRREAMRLDFPAEEEVSYKLKARLLEAQRVWRRAGQDIGRLRVAEIKQGNRRRGKVMNLVGIPDRRDDC